MSILDADESRSEISQRGRERNDNARNRVSERQLQSNHGRATLLDYSEIRQITSQFIGYVPENELMMMTPNEWKDWVIGGRQRLLDQQENMLFMAQANGLVQAGKSLKRMQKQIDQARYTVRGEEDEYTRMKQRKLEQNRREREVTKRGTRKFLDSLRNK